VFLLATINPELITHHPEPRAQNPKLKVQNLPTGCGREAVRLGVMGGGSWVMGQKTLPNDPVPSTHHAEPQAKSPAKSAEPPNWLWAGGCQAWGNGWWVLGNGSKDAPERPTTQYPPPRTPSQEPRAQSPEPKVQNLPTGCGREAVRLGVMGGGSWVMGQKTLPNDPELITHHPELQAKSPEPPPGRNPSHQCCVSRY